MKQANLLTVGLLLAVEALGSEGANAAGGCVWVQLQNTASIPNETLLASRLTAARLFADVGVSFKTTLSGAPAPGACLAVAIEFVPASPPTFHPGALAFAHPFANGGTRIRIFADRVLHGPGYNDGTVLGHVIAHEIGHVLQAIDRHSPDGLMKAAWNAADHSQMNARTLRFAPEDVELIRQSFALHRQTSTVAARRGE